MKGQFSFDTRCRGHRCQLFKSLYFSWGRTWQSLLVFTIEGSINTVLLISVGISFFDGIVTAIGMTSITNLAVKIYGVIIVVMSDITSSGSSSSSSRSSRSSSSSSSSSSSGSSNSSSSSMWQ